jgi:hypothetical protein
MKLLFEIKQLHVHSRSSAIIYFLKIWRINEFGGLTRVDLLSSVQEFSGKISFTQ